MENSTVKSLVDLKKYLSNNLNYSTLSKMDFDAYKIFVFNLFSILNELRDKGLVKEDLEDFIQNLYNDELSIVDDSDILFERRFSDIIEEIYGFCPSPFFWNSDFDTYMKKWEVAFEDDWYRKI